VKSIISPSSERKAESSASSLHGGQAERSVQSSGNSSGGAAVEEALTVQSLDPMEIAGKVSKMSLRALVKMCRFQEHQGGIRVLVSSKMEKEKLEESENMQELSKILADVNVGKLEVVIADRPKVSVGDVGSVFG
jgi:hypothetical protein